MRDAEIIQSPALNCSSKGRLRASVGVGDLQRHLGNSEKESEDFYLPATSPLHATLPPGSDPLCHCHFSEINLLQRGLACRAVEAFYC